MCGMNAAYPLARGPKAAGYPEFAQIFTPEAQMITRVGLWRGRRKAIIDLMTDSADPTECVNFGVKTRYWRLAQPLVIVSTSHTEC